MTFSNFIKADKGKKKFDAKSEGIKFLIGFPPGYALVRYYDEIAKFF
jgi:hypothetical protein